MPMQPGTCLMQKAQPPYASHLKALAGCWDVKVEKEEAEAGLFPPAQLTCAFHPGRECHLGGITSGRKPLSSFHSPHDSQCPLAPLFCGDRGEEFHAWQGFM